MGGWRARRGGREEEEKECGSPAWVWGCPVRSVQSQEGWKPRPTDVCESGLGRSGKDRASGLLAGALGDDDLPDPYRSPRLSTR